jgi:DNA replication protein DnaC
VPTFRDFKTFEDATLVLMLETAKTFADAATINHEPHWITFCGTPGTGKTFLADIVFNHLKNLKPLVDHPSLTSGAMRRHWPKTFGKIMDGEFWRIEEMGDANLLMLDELSCSLDQKGTEREYMWRVLSDRINKWTIITSNYSLDKIANLIDVRIASRMVRDGSVVVEVNTVDFANR